MGTKHCYGLDRTYDDGGDDDNNTMLHLDIAGDGDDDDDEGDDHDYDDDDGDYDGDDDGGDNVAPGHSRREELEDKLQCIQLSALARTRVS